MDNQSRRLTLSHLNKEYREALANLERYEVWKKENADKAWHDCDHTNRPNPNKAKVKRLGITIRQIMIDAERSIE